MALHVSYLMLFFKPFLFFIIWKMSYNFLIDVKGIKDAPRVIRIQKILRDFGTGGNVGSGDQQVSSNNARFGGVE
jgi:hypothetical protein